MQLTVTLKLPSVTIFILKRNVNKVCCCCCCCLLLLRVTKFFFSFNHKEKFSISARPCNILYDSVFSLFLVWEQLRQDLADFVHLLRGSQVPSNLM